MAAHPIRPSRSQEPHRAASRADSLGPWSRNPPYVEARTFALAELTVRDRRAARVGVDEDVLRTQVPMICTVLLASSAGCRGTQIAEHYDDVSKGHHMDQVP